jgi:hypothetical protein
MNKIMDLFNGTLLNHETQQILSAKIESNTYEMTQQRYCQLNRL